MSVASEVELAEWDGVLIPERVRNRGSVTLSLNAALRDYKPLRPGVYLRISHDRFGNEKGVTRQLEDANWKRTDLGWGPFAKIYKENDTGAYKKRKVTRPDGSVEWVVIRPEFRQMLKDLLDGVIDGIIFYDQDRLVRQPRDLEDLIDVIEFKKRPVLGVSSNINLMNDSERHMARVLCIMALKSSEDTARRLARRHLADAMDGEPTGRTPYGWNDDGSVDDVAAKVVRRIFSEFMTGGTFSGIVRELNEKGIPSPRGASWSQPTIKTILTNPRYGGLVSYRGQHRTEVVAQFDGWGKVLVGEDGLPLRTKRKGLISFKKWSDAQLEYEKRKLIQAEKGLMTNPLGTNARKYVYTGFLRCGLCQARMSAKFVSRRGHTIYYCPGSQHGGCGKVSRRAEPVEKLLNSYVIAWCEKQAQNRDTSPQPNEVASDRVREIQGQLDTVQQRKTDLVKDWSSGGEATQVMTQTDYYASLAGMNATLERLSKELNGIDTTPSRPARDYLGLWKNGGLDQKRSVVADIWKRVLVMPSGKGRAPFNPEHIIPIPVEEA